MAVEYDACETPMNAKPQGDRNAIMENGYEVDYDQHKEPD